MISTRNVITYNVVYNVKYPLLLYGNVAPYTGEPDVDFTVQHNTWVNCDRAVIATGANNIVSLNTTV